MPNRRISLIAGATTIIGFLIGILAASPSQWKQNLAEWLSVLVIVLATAWPLVLGIICIALGFLFGRFVFPDPSRLASAQPNIMYESEFSNRLQDLANGQEISRIDILSYTNETVADVIKYEYRNKEGLLIRVLSRSWLEEESDETAYNQRLAGSKTRRWSKAEMIERIAQTPWNNVGSREQRFYWGLHPLIKAILVHSDVGILAFLTIYNWQEWPADGGSPFKGANHVGVLLDSRAPKDSVLIGYLASQFKFLWEYQSHGAQDARSHGYTSVFSLVENTTPKG